MEQSLQFKILNEVAENSEISLSKFSQQHYVSYNPIYKALGNLNTYLSHFELKITKFKLVGKEYRIRIFLFHFYWEIFGGGKWPFRKVAKYECKEEVHKLEKVFSSNFTWIEHEKLCFWIAILVMREQINNVDTLENLPIFWKNLDEEGYKMIKKVTLNLSLKLVKRDPSHLLVALYLICEEKNIKEVSLSLSNFDDPISRGSERLIRRLLKDKLSKDAEIKLKLAHNELIKIIHYSQLGENYPSLVLKVNQASHNFSHSLDFPELLYTPAKQAFQIIQVLTTQKLLKVPSYSIYIATKYGVVEMRKIKILMEDKSPGNFTYYSLWETNEEVDVILTDVEELPTRQESLKIQFSYPFNDKKASEIVEKIKTYINIKGVSS